MAKIISQLGDMIAQRKNDTKLDGVVRLFNMIKDILKKKKH